MIALTVLLKPGSEIGTAASPFTGIIVPFAARKV
jgi:hypothetical protein